MIFNLDIYKEEFTEWWTQEKKQNPVEATIGSAVVGGVATTSGAACIGNGLHRLISGENTYAGIGPILTISGGLVFTVLGIKSLSESAKLYKEIKSKETSDKEKE